MSLTLLSQAPARIDLAGGTLDIWPLYLFHENAQTLNVAIKCYARCRLTQRRDRAIQLISRDLRRREIFSSLEALRSAKSVRLPLLARLAMAFEPSGGFVLETDSDSPAGAGLGGSSALNIALCGALNRFTGRFTGKNPPLAKLIEVARDAEAQVLRVPTGVQDYYAAAFGCIQAIRMTSQGVRSEKLAVDRRELAARIVLCYTGESRNSGANNWEVFKAHLDGDRAVIQHFDRIAAIASEMRQALEEGDWAAAARLLHREWETRKKNYPGITTPRIEELIQLARRQGARAAKVCGAGGGGCLFFLAEPEAKAGLETALRRAGVRVMPFEVAPRGVEVRP